MINSISSISNAMYTNSSSAMQRQPPPPERDVFQLADSDSDGLVAGTELEAIVEKIAETSGNTISTENALSAFDADGDGGLNGEELLALLSENGFSLSEGQNGEGGAPPPPPPPSMDKALSSYAQNLGDDLIQQLISNLQGDENNQEESSVINILS